MESNTLTNLIDKDLLAVFKGQADEAYVAQEYKTGSATVKKVLSDNNLTDALVAKINAAGESDFSGAYADLTGKPTINGHEVAGALTAAGLGLATPDDVAANAKAIAGKQDKLTAGANVTISGSTISAKDTTYGEATPSKAGLMSAADKGRLDKAIKSGDELMTTNPSTPGSTLYISKIDNALYAADKRFNVSGKMISGDGAETELSAVNLAAPFAGDYDKQVRIQPGSTMVMRIRFDNQYNGQFPGYPYGYIIVSFYFNLGPKSVTVRAYNAYEPQGSGWKTLDGEKMSSASYRMAWRFRNKYYGIQEFEVTIEGAASGSEGRTSLSQIEMHLDRPYSGRNPFLSKYAAEELYYPLTAPKFIGDLQGTADAAKTADKATTASSADSAAKADRLKTARKVSISGAVNGSATWDGSDDLSIVVAGDSAAAGFLAAHPVGTYMETSGADPNDYGGTWERAPSRPHTWLRTK